MLPPLDLGINPLWLQLRQSVPLDDHWFYVVGMIVAHSATFWLGCSLIALFDYLGMFKKYLIEPKAKYPEPELVRDAVRHELVWHILILPAVTYFLYPLTKADNPTFLSDTLPDVWTVIAQYVGCAVIEDTLFYWVHRALHHEAIYKYIHKQHHRFKRTIGFAAEYAHPIEVVIADLLPTFAGPTLLRTHFLVTITWIFYRTCETIDAHCGYKFPFSPFNVVLRIQGGVERHDFHHSHNVGSYGSQTKFWDWVTGSDKAFKEYQKRKMLSKKE